MKNTYFSTKLYKEGLAQLALPGFITGGILLAVVFLQGQSEILTAISRSATSTWTPHILDAWVPITFYTWTAPFLFAILLFNFLNSRKKSDYYHALPVKKEALFGSFAAAIYTWLISTTVVAILLSTMFFVFAGATVGLADLGGALLGFTSVILYTAALTMLAMSLSGTLFSNIVVGSLFLWMPLIVSALFVEGVSTLVPSIPFGEVSFFGLSLGLTPFTFSVAVLNWDLHWPAGVVPDALWTSFLALAMLAAATFFFVRRKSEMAGDSAPSKRMQAAYRVAVALPPLMPAMIFVPLEFVRTPSAVAMTAAENLFAFTVSAVVAVILICAFELITTKTWRNLRKVPLSFGIALLVAGGFAVSVWAVATYEASFTPRAENISWISIPGDVRSNTSHADRIGGREVKLYWSEDRQEWRGDKAIQAIVEEELRISDEELNRAMSAVLAELRADTEWLPQGRSTADYLSIEVEPPQPNTQSTSNRGSRETLVFEIRTTTGQTKRRTLTYAETFRTDSNDGRTTGTSTTYVVPNQLGEALANVRLP